MNANLKSQRLVGAFSSKQVICALLLGLGVSPPAHAVGGAAASVAGWSIALVVILAVAYLFARRKH